MTIDQKNSILVLINEHVARHPSQKKAADALENVSEATLINFRKLRWDTITDEMWLNVGKQLGWNTGVDQWQSVETSLHRKLNKILHDAQRHANVYAVTAMAGAGKSHTGKLHSLTVKHAYHVSCSEFMVKKTFLKEILLAMNVNNDGYTVYEMIKLIKEVILKQEAPLLILDEVDKLRDEVLYFFISLYNVLEGKCGIVLLSTAYMDKRITRGITLGKKGYEEIFSRIGRRFIALSTCSAADIKQLCKSNGVMDDLTITQLIKESEGDLRRVKRGVHKAKLINN